MFACPLLRAAAMIADAMMQTQGREFANQDKAQRCLQSKCALWRRVQPQSQSDKPKYYCGLGREVK